MDDRFVGKTIPTSPFTADSGETDSAVATALAAWQVDRTHREQVLFALLTSRVFVPVTAVLDSSIVDEHGRKAEKDSHMATVSLSGPDGQRRLLVFTSTEDLARWDQSARPIAVYFRQACEAALTDGADGIVVNLLESRGFGVTYDEVRAAARGALAVELLSRTDVPTKIAAVLSPIAQEFRLRFELIPARSPMRVARIELVGTASAIAAALPATADALGGSEELALLIPGGLELGAQESEQAR